MLSDDEIAGLPGDEKLGFIKLMSLIEMKIKAMSVVQKGQIPADFASSAVGYLMAFAETHSLSLAISPPPSDDAQQFWDWYHDAIRRATFLKAKFQFETRDKIRSVLVSSIQLSDDARVKIRHLIEEIRKRLPSIETTDRQKENLNDRLTAFAAEIEKTRSRTDWMFSFVLEASKVVGESAKNLEPLVDQILKILGRGHQENEAKQIEAPKEAKRLPAPDESDKNSQMSSPAIDDDIPF